MIRNDHIRKKIKIISIAQVTIHHVIQIKFVLCHQIFHKERAL